MSGPVGMSRAQAEEIAYQQREWKAGYRAATEHQRWGLVAGIVALVVILRRWRIPMVAITVWIGLAAVCLWPVTVVAIVLEVRRRRAVHRALAMTAKDDPFPDDSEVAA